MPRVLSSGPDPDYSRKDYAVGKFDRSQETKRQAQRINAFLAGGMKSGELTEDLRDAFRRAEVSGRFSANRTRTAVVQTRDEALRAQKVAESKLNQKENEIAALKAELASKNAQLAESTEVQQALRIGYLADVQTLANIVSAVHQDNRSKQELQLRLDALRQENGNLMTRLRDALVTADRALSHNELLRIDCQHMLALIDAWSNPALQPLQARTFPQE